MPKSSPMKPPPTLSDPADLELRPWGAHGAWLRHGPTGLVCLRAEQDSYPANAAAARRDLAVIIAHWRPIRPATPALDPAPAKRATPSPLPTPSLPPAQPSPPATSPSPAQAKAPVTAAATPRIPTQLAMGAL